MNIKVVCITIVCLMLHQDALAQNTTEVMEFLTATTEAPECPHYRDPDVTKGGFHCCSNLYKEFRRRYHNANLRLTNFLEKLRAWNCLQFEEECEQRYFDFNRFTSLVYDRFCDVKAFEKNCQSEFQTFEEIFNISLQDFNRRDAALEIDRNEVLLSSPCLQVQTYQYGQTYYEISRPLFAFCETFWCGFDEEVVASINPSSWLCIRNR